MTSNVPEPLKRAPTWIFADTHTQMSFGERAALEGILSQLRPRVSLELGLGAGGATHRIGRHSQAVHSFDLKCQPRVFLGPNVHLHEGDTHEILAPWLAEQTGMIDFVLIDGDHTMGGARQDLLDVLEAPACRRTLIMAHDTTNEEVRAGISSALMDHTLGVVYRDLDFMRGYTFQHGDWAGITWGGFALIVTGDPETEGYGHHPEQTLYAPA